MKQFNKIRTSVTIDPEVFEALQQLADREERSISQQINKILKDYFKAEGEK